MVEIYVVPKHSYTQTVRSLHTIVSLLDVICLSPDPIILKSFYHQIEQGVTATFTFKNSK
jgi:hypothetical protein